MDYLIRSRGEALHVDIPQPGRYRTRLLESLSLCSQGECECPTDEYQKLATFEVEDRNGAIALDFTARSGEQLDPVEIAKCLDWTIDHIETA
jgi:hypothetical protein